MIRKKDCVAMVLAGGQGARLYALTTKMAKPAVPFGGKFRIIDFTLSNCTNSNIDTVGVLTQYQPHELNAYIGSGQPWDLDRLDGGVQVLPPYMTGKSGEWYKGTANAICQNTGFIDGYSPDYVLVLSGDHVYKMDYAKMIEQHKKTGADATIATIEVDWEEASRFGILSVGEDGKVTEFAEKPESPQSNLASMGIYVFTWKKLKEYLFEDDADPESNNDFGGDIIPKMLYNGEKMMTYRFEGYWKDVGTINSLWDANMDMLSTKKLDMFDGDWTVYTRSSSAPPHFVGQTAEISHSIVTSGCEIEGNVENSVLFDSVTIGKGATVRYSMVMPRAVIEPGAVVEYAIIAEGAVIGKNARVGADPKDAMPDEWGIAVVASNVHIRDGAEIKPREMVEFVPQRTMI